MEDQRLLTLMMPTLGLYTTCPFGNLCPPSCAPSAAVPPPSAAVPSCCADGLLHGADGRTFQQITPFGFRAKIKDIDIVTYTNGSSLPEGACVCPDKPAWVRIENDLFVEVLLPNYLCAFCVCSIAPSAVYLCLTRCPWSMHFATIIEMYLFGRT